MALKLQSNPGAAESPTYEISIPYFGSGTPEQWLKFQRDLNRVIIGQNITTGPPKYAMARRLLEGDALAKFNERAVENGTETNEHFAIVLQELTTHVLPQKALAYQKRYMRRFMRKPRALKIRLFVARATELNSYLRQFPPFADGQELQQDEMMDIFESAIPASWQNQAIIQGFNILEHTPNEFVEFCERIESIETDEPEKPKPSTDKDADGKKKGKRKRGGEDSSSTKVCMLHGPGHSTEECKVLQAQAKRMKGAYESQTPEGKKQWKRRDEMNAIVEQLLEQLDKRKRGRKEQKELDNCEADFENLRVSSDSEDSSDDES